MIRELGAEVINSGRKRYTNSVTAHPTDAFMAFHDAHGIAYNDFATARQAAGSDHNRRETALFVASTARHAVARA